MEARLSLRRRLEDELEELERVLPGLEADLGAAAEELKKGEVIRRHVARNPERFSPHERENVLEQVQGLAVRRQTLETTLEALRERAELLREVGGLLGGEAASDDAGEAAQAVEAERLRIARDLHDGPAQVLSNLVLEAEILERLLRRDPSLLAAELQEFKAAVRAAVADMRRFLSALRPVSLDELGLVATLRRLLAEHEERTGVACSLELRGEERQLPPEVEEAVYWIVQESLANVARHASARSAVVEIEVARERVRLHVRDDGVGFDPRTYHQSGGRRKLGVLGMKERSAAVGGSLEVRSEPGSGTEVEASFPLAG